MESLPTEILDHVFNQFPKICEICQQKCLRASSTQEFSKCSKTCERWNGLIEKKLPLKKCYSDFENLISVTLNIQRKGKFGMKLWLPMTDPNANIVDYHKTVVHVAPIVDSIIENSLVDRDGRIKVGHSILQVNEISFHEGSITFGELCLCLWNKER